MVIVCFINVAEMIIASLNGSYFKDYMLAVTYLLTHEELEEAQTRTVILRDVDVKVPYANVEESIKNLLIRPTVFPNFSYDGSFTGSYSIVLGDPRSALTFSRYMNGRNFFGKPASCYMYSSSFKKSIQLNLHVRNVPIKWSTEELKEYCSRFGEVNSCLRIQKTEKYVHGFVSFFEKESVEGALTATKEEVFLLSFF